MPFVKKKDPQSNVTVDWDRTGGSWEEEELRVGLCEYVQTMFLTPSEGSMLVFTHLSWTTAFFAADCPTLPSSHTLCWDSDDFPHLTKTQHRKHASLLPSETVFL